MNTSVAFLHSDWIHNGRIHNSIKVDSTSVTDINMHSTVVSSHAIVQVSDALFTLTCWGSPRWEDKNIYLRWGEMGFTLQDLNVLFESPTINSNMDIYIMSSHIDWVNGHNKVYYRIGSPYFVNGMKYTMDPDKICKLLCIYFTQGTTRRHDFAMLLIHVPSEMYMLYRDLLDNSFVQGIYAIYNNCKTNAQVIISLCYRYRNRMNLDKNKPPSSMLLGGGRNELFSLEELKPYICDNNNNYSVNSGAVYRFHTYSAQQHTRISVENSLVCKLPLSVLVDRLIVVNLKLVAAAHGLYIQSRVSQNEIIDILKNHHCGACPEHVSEFLPAKSAAQLRRIKNYHAVKQYRSKNTKNTTTIERPATPRAKKSKDICNISESESFPPCTPKLSLTHKIVHDWCSDMAVDSFEETGCAICGEITLKSKSSNIQEAALNLEILQTETVTRRERKQENDRVESLPGPVMIKGLSQVCQQCHKSLSANKVPKYALANGMWLGDVPLVLSDLTFAEKLLIARVRHNRCIVRVSSGWHKMTANAISFTNPTPKVYNILPPPIKELEEVLAFIYTGPCKPTAKDLERTPLLVRRTKVSQTLEWLKLNHSDYYDLEISQRNLKDYPESGLAVLFEYVAAEHNKPVEVFSVYDNEEEAGTTSGPCPFAVHGLTEVEFSTKSLKALKAIAAQHLLSGGKVLAIGHSKNPESIYGNPQLYPQMMPWLFPYGLGGIGSQQQKDLRISDFNYKRHLLLYHDKRFQRDHHFPLIAFNHEQIKNTTTAGYLLADKVKFNDISNRLLQMDSSVLTSICNRLNKDEKVNPESDAEKRCFQLLKDLDHIGGNVMGSVTNKKYMRNEIWSLISFIGSPSWFITFAPAENLNPISIYWADTKEKFDPAIKDYDTRYRIISQNPVAGAKFFHFLCKLFIKHILGVDTKHRGLYGETEAYYGAVEQQGRLALHLHLVLWIKGSLSPQEMRDKIIDPESDFQKKIVEYLEGLHMGEFMTGSMDAVVSKVNISATQDSSYVSPIQTIPESPPGLCRHDTRDDCGRCKKQTLWWDKFKYIVDDILLKSNVHSCGGGKTGRRPTCFNKQGNCKARFPRKIVNQTEVDPETGALNMKKGEAWLNTFTPVLTYLLRCNTDVTSLLSGTAVKAIVAYISDYITKTPLKTYTMFDAIKGVYERSSDLLSSTMFSSKEKARKLITQIMNSLTAKSEIGGPMASMYLLGNPDHYTSHKFVVFYWKSYVNNILNQANPSSDSSQTDEKVIVQRQKDGKLVAYNTVLDYVYRPSIYKPIPLYTWIQTCQKVKIKIAKKKPQTSDNESDSDDELDIVSDGPTTTVLEKKYMPENVLPNKEQSDEEADLDESDVHDSDEDDSDSDELDIMSNETEDGLSPSKPLKNKITHNKFLKDHPQHDTHHVTLNPKRLNFVPNFVGGSLPRCDRGDREYYCATMLVIFKPWRELQDLKNSDSTWDEAFNTHDFTPAQTKLMKNFNLRYECNDARDDYSAQLKKQNEDQVKGPFVSFDIGEDHGDYDRDDAYQDDSYPNDKNDDDIDEYMTPGRYGRIRQAEMEATEHCLHAAGWLNDSPNGVASVPSEPIKPDVTQIGSKWKSVVNQRRQEILTARDSKEPVKRNKVMMH